MDQGFVCTFVLRVHGSIVSHFIIMKGNRGLGGEANINKQVAKHKHTIQKKGSKKSVSGPLMTLPLYIHVKDLILRFDVITLLFFESSDMQYIQDTDTPAFECVWIHQTEKCIYLPMHVAPTYRLSSYTLPPTHISTFWLGVLL